MHSFKKLTIKACLEDFCTILTLSLQNSSGFCLSRRKFFMTIINSLKNAGFGRSSLLASSGQIWQAVSAKRKKKNGEN